MNYWIDIADSSEEENVKIKKTYHNVLTKYVQEEKRSDSILDVLEEFDMPKGFNIDKNADTKEHFRARANSIDEISSIKE